MNKNNKHKLIPKLRFPEFQNAGEWEVKKLGEVFKSFSGGTPDTSKKEYYNGKIPFIRSAEIGKNSTELFITETGLENSSAKMVKKGDLLVALYGANSGEVAISKIDGAINQAILCFQSEYSNEFTYHFLSGKKNWIVSKYVQGGQGNLSGEIVKSISLPFPSKSEQQKIASCLSSLDEVITGEQQKLELLKQHKKGLLQNLFPQEGETVPKLRFKEFENSGEWEVKKLIQIATYVNDKMPIENLSINSYISTENLLADYAGVTLASKLPSSGNFTKYQKGDILVSNIRPYLKKVWFADKDGACSNDVIVIRSGTFVSDKLLSYLLKNDAFISYIMKGAEGVKMPRGDKDSIKEYPILYPKDKTEQQKIASCLSSLDDLITAQTQKIEQLQRHKKGLLQGLFPNMNEQHG